MFQRVLLLYSIEIQSIFNRVKYSEKVEQKMPSTMNSKIANAAKWSTITEVMAKLVTPITNMILARLLAPEIFGIVASVNVVFSFCDIFSDAGFQKYIIQHKVEKEEEIGSYATVAFWSNLTVSLCIWAIVAIFSTPIAKLVGCEGKGLAIAVSCASLPLTAFSSIQNALLKRNMNFKPLFFVRIVTIVIPIVVTVPLAFITRSYWSMIIGTIAINLGTVIMMSILLEWRPKLWFSFSMLREILSFSLWSLLESILVWVINWGDVFIVGNILSSYYLGLYKTSMNMVNQIIAVVSASMVPVLLAALSRLQDDDVEFKNVYYKFTEMSGLLLLPMGIGMWIYRDVMCRVALGSSWMESATLMGIWGLISALSIIFNSYNGDVLIAKGKPNLSVVVQIIQIICIVPVVYFSAKTSFETLSYARALVRIVGMVVYSFVVWKVAGISFFTTIKKLAPYILGAVLMGIFGWQVLLKVDRLLFQLISIVLCAIIYFLLISVFPSSRRTVKDTLQRVLGRLSKRQINEKH